MIVPTRTVTIRGADTIWHEPGGWFDARWHFSLDCYHDPDAGEVVIPRDEHGS